MRRRQGRQYLGHELRVVVGQGSSNESTQWLYRLVMSLTFLEDAVSRPTETLQNRASYTHGSPASPHSAYCTMPLLDLPNEVLGSIIDCVDPGDLDHFVESSPLLKSLATHALEVHREREQEYTEIGVFGCHEHIGQHPLQVLEQICANPQVAWYPRSLTVECCSTRGVEHFDEEFARLMNDDEFDKKYEPEYFDGGFWESDAINVYRVIKSWAKDIRDLVFHSGYFDEEESECWYNQIRKGNREAVVGLLLMLLPNLEIIEFRTWSTHMNLLVKIVQRITRPPKESSKETKEGACVLMKLRELRLRGGEISARWEDFGLAGCFALLPSMRKICAVEVYCWFFNSSTHAWTQVEPRSSNIDEIHMEHAFLRTWTILDCLRCLKTLRKLHYDWNSVPDGGFPYILHCEDLGRILAALVEYFQSSLETLCLQGPDLVPFKGSIDNSISLGSFEKLTNASLPIQLFTSVPKAQAEASAPIADGKNPQNSSLATFPRLVDILPRSMEEVIFSGAVEMQNIETMLSGLAEHKASRLPRLSKIIFSSVGASIGSSTATARILQSQCHRLGIDVVLGDRIAPTSSPCP